MARFNASFNPEEGRIRDLSHDELDLHQFMLMRSKLKSTVRTSTILAGFAMVSVHHVCAVSAYTSYYIGCYG